MRRPRGGSALTRTRRPAANSFETGQRRPAVALTYARIRARASGKQVTACNLQIAAMPHNTAPSMERQSRIASAADPCRTVRSAAGVDTQLARGASESRLTVTTAPLRAWPESTPTAGARTTQARAQYTRALQLGPQARVQRPEKRFRALHLLGSRLGLPPPAGAARPFSVGARASLCCFAAMPFSRLAGAAAAHRDPR